MNYLLLLATWLLCCVTSMEAACDECYSAHACIGRNQFQVCTNGIRNTNQNFTCPSETAVCTKYGQICFELGVSITPACGDVSKCADCTNVDDGGFACVSRTTFRQCFNGESYGNEGVCPDKYLCSVEGAKTGTPCVNQCNANTDNDICDRNAEGSGNSPVTDAPNTTDDGSSSSSSSSTSTSSSPTTTTTFAPTPTPSTSGACAAGTGRYAQPNDTLCTSYIYCFWQGGVMRSATRNCPTNNPYFNATSTTCGSVRPTRGGCV